jgi:fibronectin type 3 domain-containing protein
MKTIIVLVSVIVLLVGCGVKGPPVPWETIVPKRIVDLEAVPREEKVLLEWTIPKENTDKSALTDLAGFSILRSEGDLIGGECKGCGEKPTVVYEMKLGAKEEVRGKRVTAVVEDLEPRKVYVYQVVSVNRRKDPSSPSNPVWIYWDYPPQTPGLVRVEGGDKRVDLSWEPVVGATGYQVYRRGEGDTFPATPLNREVLTSTRYPDLNVENEKKYIYSVRAVRRVVKTDIEGKGSLEVSATPTDLIPPGPPTGLVAVPLKTGMELNWQKNREPDLLGYYVYRRRPGEREFRRVTEAPVMKETFLDSQVAQGQEYEYAVTAVDHSARKNESPFSEEVRVIYQY